MLRRARCVRERPDVAGGGRAAFELTAGDGVVRPRLRAGMRFGALGGKAWLEEVLDRVVAANRRRNADEAGDDRADRERQQRIGHRGRRLVRAVPGTVAMAAAVVI